MLAVSTAAVLDACAQRGVDPDAVIADAGAVSPVARDPEARISRASAAAIWRLALTRVADPALVVDAAAGPQFGAYRVLDYLAATAHTVGEAVSQVAAHAAFINPALELSLEREARGVRLVVATRAPISPAYLEYTLAAFYVRIRDATRVAYAPLDVELECSRPRRHAEVYARAFGCAPRFARSRSTLLIGHDAWAALNPRRDPVLSAILIDHAETLTATLRSSSFADDVRAAIAERLPDGTPSLAAIARQLATSTRSLQRRLASEGLSFHDLIDQARVAEARTYLVAGELSVSEVAERVGYARPSSFTRAFRRWMQQSPRDYRRRARPT